MLFENLSKIVDNNPEEDDEYNTMSPLGYRTLIFFSVYSAVLLVAATLVNGSLLILFAIYKELRTTLNSFIIAITALNLIAALFSLPFVIVSNYYQRFAICLFLFSFFYICRNRNKNY